MVLFGVMTKLILLLIFSILISGCTTLNKQQLDAVERGEKAMVVSRCIALTPPVGIMIKDYNPAVCTTSWYVTEGQKESATAVLQSTNTQPIIINVVEPGIYNLEFFVATKLDSWNGYYNTYKASNLNGLAKFEVKGGEIIYVGDLEFNLRNSAVIAKAISVLDNRAVAKTALARRYSSKFSDRIQTRLIQLSPEAIKFKNTDNAINTNFVTQ